MKVGVARYAQPTWERLFGRQQFFTHFVNKSELIKNVVVALNFENADGNDEKTTLSAKVHREEMTISS
jgi:hypothetical protein